MGFSDALNLSTPHVIYVHIFFVYPYTKWHSKLSHCTCDQCWAVTRRYRGKESTGINGNSQCCREVLQIKPQYTGTTNLASIWKSKLNFSFKNTVFEDHVCP